MVKLSNCRLSPICISSCVNKLKNVARLLREMSGYMLVRLLTGTLPPD